jgi:creatinine amidohydrolase
MESELIKLKWPQIEKILKMSNIIILPVGSIEQHGPHLPINVDSCCAHYIAQQIAQKFNEDQSIRVLIAPTINYTEVETFKEFPGTIGISLETEIKVIEEIVRSLLSGGFHNILVLNGHSSNTIPINAALRKVNSDFPNAGLYGINWWSLGNLQKILKSPPCLHAEEMETSLCLVAEPDLVEMNQAYSEYPELSLSEKWATPDFYGLAKTVFYHSRKIYPRYGKSLGIMGDATVASRETGEKIVEAVVNDFVEIIREVVRTDKPGNKG